MAYRLSIRKVLVGGAAAALLAAAVSSAWSVASSAPARPSTVPATQPQYPRKYIDKVVQQKWLDAGPTVLGATVATTSNVLDLHGHKIGTEDFTCTVVGVTPPADEMQCMGELQLPNGTIESTVMIDRANIETRGGQYTTASIGGKGAFVGVSGETHWTVLAPGVALADNVSLTFPS
jgi:hypothetical protein